MFTAVVRSQRGLNWPAFILDSCVTRRYPSHVSGFRPVTSSSALLHVSHDPCLFHVWTALHEPLEPMSTPLLNHFPRWHSRGCTYRTRSMRQGFCLPPTVINKGSLPVTCLRAASRLLNVSVLTWTFYCLVVTHGFNVYADGLGLDIDVVDLFCTYSDMQQEHTVTMAQSH
jgi:hypothetical protein